MTESDPPTEQELREMIREELRDMLDDQDEEPTYSRRQVAKALGLAGTAGLAGAGGMSAATDSAKAHSGQAGDWATAANPGDFYSDDHFAADHANGGLSTPPTDFVNWGFEGGTPKYVDDTGTTHQLDDVALTDDDGDGIYTLPNAGDGINTGELTVTGEPMVVAELTADQSISANTLTTVDYDSEIKDVTNSYDLTNDQFTPPETGLYYVDIYVTFGVGADQDLLELRFTNVTDSTTELQTFETASGTSFQAVGVSSILPLDSTKSYEVGAKNNNSSDTLKSPSERTRLAISRWMIE